jgi:probable phosphoglycerate mutase
VTDLPLTAQGEAEAARLGQRLEGLTFAAVLTSPLKRAVRTCELAASAPRRRSSPTSWSGTTGRTKVRTSAEIHAERPDWQLFRDGCPDGESPEQIGARADGVIRRVRAIEGNTLLFSSGHFLRVFARALARPAAGAGRYFLLGTASLSAMGYEHDRSDPVIRFWNEMPHERRVEPGAARAASGKVRR